MYVLSFVVLLPIREKSSLTFRRRFDARINNPVKADEFMASHSRSYISFLPRLFTARLHHYPCECASPTATKGCGHAGKTAIRRWIRLHSLFLSDNSPLQLGQRPEELLLQQVVATEVRSCNMADSITLRRYKLCVGVQKQTKIQNTPTRRLCLQDASCLCQAVT